MKLHFNANDIKELLEHSRGAKRRSPTFSQQFEGAYRFDGKDVDVDKLEGLDNWPKPEDVDPAKIPVGLWLVGDQGVYLMSNGEPNIIAGPGERRKIAQSYETDPKLNPDTWYDNKVASFGGDDGVEFANERFVQGLLELARDGVACISVNSRGFAPAAPDRSKVRCFSLGTGSGNRAARPAGRKRESGPKLKP